jgi:hypothetical protein
MRSRRSGLAMIGVAAGQTLACLSVIGGMVSK